MRPIRWYWILSLFAAGCVPAGAEIGGTSGGQTVLITPDMVPDASYRPKAGDRALLYAIEGGYLLERFPLLKDMTAYDIYARSVQAKDAERLLELQEQGWLHWAAPGTRVSIISIQDRNHTGANTTSEIRVVDDANKNQTYWTSSSYLARLIHTEPE
jgi:hypothetical protein